MLKKLLYFLILFNFPLIATELENIFKLKQPKTLLESCLDTIILMESKTNEKFFEKSINKLTNILNEDIKLKIIDYNFNLNWQVKEQREYDIEKNVKKINLNSDYIIFINNHMIKVKSKKTKNYFFTSVISSHIINQIDFIEVDKNYEILKIGEYNTNSSSLSNDTLRDFEMGFPGFCCYSLKPSPVYITKKYAECDLKTFLYILKLKEACQKYKNIH
ncbi:MAG: hypothetical protein WDZ41_03145 [Candidatus Babeliales bacterium]